ncbi:hypothetical protein ACTWP5_12150 [Streptomyces sp. 4N509B]|uniref:hypothetical protein n=1 Tax=Streptomyces sp. 4N509B TaxID=3457413 RepID=UPI003FD581AA
MSYNQPGPYGQQPPGQPGPYGGPPQGPPPGGPPGPPPGGGNPYGPGGTPGAPPPVGGQPGQPGHPGQPPGPGYGYPTPQQPGPYGQQPAPPPGQYPGQVPGQIPGQIPGQPPGQPPYGQPGGGAGGGGRKNRTLLIGVAVVAALAVVGGGAFFLLGGDDGSIAADDGTRYTISLPDQSGEFFQHESGDGGGPTDEELAEAGLQEMESAEATYLTVDPQAFEEAGGVWEPGTMTLGVVGLWGEVQEPEQAVDALFALATEEAGQEEDVEFELIGDAPSEYTDSEAVLKCQQARGMEPDPDLGYRTEVTLCVWSDYSTVGLVYVAPMPDLPEGFDPNAGEAPEFQAPEPVSTDAAAEYVRQLRTDSIQPREGGGEGSGDTGEEGSSGADNNLDQFENGP